MQSSPQLLLYDEEYQNKAIYYLRVTSEVELLYNEYRGISVYEEVYYHTLYQMTSTMITNAFFSGNDKASSEDALLRLEDAREICQNAISTLNIVDGNLLQLVNYLQLKRNIGKTYLFSAFAENRDINMAKAYQELMIPFYWEDNRVVEELLITASYALLTGCCTETDIEMILDNCIQRIQNLRQDTDVAELIEAEFDLLNICDAILLNYEYGQGEAKNFGHEMWVDLNTSFYMLLNTYQKEQLEGYRDIFGN